MEIVNSVPFEVSVHHGEVRLRTSYPPAQEVRERLKKSGFRFRYDRWEKLVRNRDELSQALRILEEAGGVMLVYDVDEEVEERLKKWGWSGKIAMYLPQYLRYLVGWKAMIVGYLPEVRAEIARLEDLWRNQ